MGVRERESETGRVGERRQTEVGRSVVVAVVTGVAKSQSVSLAACCRAATRRPRQTMKNVQKYTHNRGKFAQREREEESERAAVAAAVYGAWLRV